MDKNLYYTNSWNIAAWFMHKGIPLEFQIMEDKVTTFYYHRTEQTKQAIEEYNHNLELKDFISCYRKIKELVNQGK